MGDQVAGLHAGTLGRRIVDRRDHLDQAVLQRDLDAEATELTFGLDLHLLVVLRIEILGVRVERGQHAVDRVLDQVEVVDFLDVVVAHPFKNVAKQIELPIGFGTRRNTDSRHQQAYNARHTGN